MSWKCYILVFPESLDAAGDIVRLRCPTSVSKNILICNFWGLCDICNYVCIDRFLLSGQRHVQCR